MEQLVSAKRDHRNVDRDKQHRIGFIMGVIERDTNQATATRPSAACESDERGNANKDRQRGQF